MNNKKILLFAIITAVVVLVSYLSIKMIIVFVTSKVDNDYQKLGIEINDYNISYYTIYDKDFFGEYKVYKINNSSIENIEKQLKNSKYWSKNKFYEYIMSKFYEKNDESISKIDRTDLYYYNNENIYCIIDVKNAKLYFYRNLIQSIDNDDHSIIDAKIDDYINKEVYSVKGGLQNDGTDYYVYEFAEEKGREIIETLEKNSKWSKEKFDDNKLNYFKYNEEVHLIKNGYYYYELVCRTSNENKKKNFTKDEATGYEIGVYDADKNILYYYWTGY